VTPPLSTIHHPLRLLFLIFLAPDKINFGTCLLTSELLKKKHYRYRSLNDFDLFLKEKKEDGFQM